MLYPTALCTTGRQTGRRAGRGRAPIIAVTGNRVSWCLSHIYSYILCCVCVCYHMCVKSVKKLYVAGERGVGGGMSFYSERRLCLLLLPAWEAISVTSIYILGGFVVPPPTSPSPPPRGPCPRSLYYSYNKYPLISLFVCTHVCMWQMNTKKAWYVCLYKYRTHAIRQWPLAGQRTRGRGVSVAGSGFINENKYTTCTYIHIYG